MIAAVLLAYLVILIPERAVGCQWRSSPEDRSCPEVGPAR